MLSSLVLLVRVCAYCLWKDVPQSVTNQLLPTEPPQLLRLRVDVRQTLLTIQSVKTVANSLENVNRLLPCGRPAFAQRAAGCPHCGDDHGSR